MGIAVNHSEQVVEIMGNATGHDTQALQRLGLLHLLHQFSAFFFGQLALGDVANGNDVTDASCKVNLATLSFQVAPGAVGPLSRYFNDMVARIPQLFTN